MPNTTDYTQDLSIVAMVYNRTPFLAATTNNNDIIKAYIWEVMNEVEGCFKMAANIGKEDSYTTLMRSIIADLVAVYIMLLISAQNAQGTSTSTAQVRFLKKAKAGSAEAEWGELDIKKSGVLNIGGAGLIQKYELSASRKARDLGCILDICTDCLALTQLQPLPFITITDCGCGCS